MNTRAVNSAAGVVLAAMQQNRTPAGIALALESAGLLMSPEAAKDLASVSEDAVRVAERAVGELKREHEESARLRARVAELEAGRLPYAELAKRERSPGRRAAWRMLAQAEESERVAEALLATPQSPDEARAMVAEDGAQ